MKNEFEVRGDITAIIINSLKYGRLEALIDTTDLPLVLEFKNTWYAYWDESVGNYYIQGNLHIWEGKRIRTVLHRYLTGNVTDMIVDHKNHNTLDNRRSVNLRVCTASENKQNMKGARSDSRSGVRGVTWHKYRCRWCVQVRANGKQSHIGYFDDIIEAEAVAVEARARLMTHSTN